MVQNQTLDKLEKELSDIHTDLSLNYWNAANQGSEENFKKVLDSENKLNKFLADEGKYKQVQLAWEQTGIGSIKRALGLLVNDFKSKQVDTEILERINHLSNEIEKTYTGFRTDFENEKLTDNQVEDILKSSVDNRELESVWKAQKSIGRLVQDNIIDLINLRNQSAKHLGYKNYREMSFRLSELDPDFLDSFFEELAKRTNIPFKNLKKEIDIRLCDKYGLDESELMPWHYQNRFFQEVPDFLQIDLDSFFSDVDIEKVTVEYFESMGLEVEDINARSSLYEKPSKNQHAFCIQIDRLKSDIRVLCNLKPNSRWMNTNLHEFGHAVYDKYIESGMNWTLTTPAHIFTTEAIAMLFGRRVSDQKWIEDNTGKQVSDQNMDEIEKYLKAEQLIFIRWALVMYHFEKALYDNPKSDLNNIWWELVSEYQLINKPKNRNEPDWATKIHIATAPCYYQNYVLGEVFSVMIEDKLNEISANAGSWKSDKAVGQWLINNIFKFGALKPWRRLVLDSVGSELSAEAYCERISD